ncbi:MAG: phosphoenolpyruvate--protein phosphotransferase, partial [Candidatus Omnitrophota bacterium]
RTSHTAIIARSLGIPAVVGVDSISSISVGSTVIVDGNKGDIVANPTKDSLRVYTGKADDFYKTRKIIYDMRNVSAKTVDGHEVFVESNIEFPEELSMVSEYGSEGVGLYRTEYLFLSQRELPSEEQQYRAYSLVAKKMAPKKVVFRTIDIGGDKFLSHTASQRENSPFLGCRAIRFSLANINLFKAQLRAILRASVYKNVKVMFPLISGIEELRKAKDILQECKEELKNEGTKYDENIKVGVMIEVPSAALTADILAKESDFFSIGTNDLIQYSLAVDRVNEKVAYLYEAAHPAVLKLIKMIIDAGHANSIPVAMCGEMSGDPLFVLLLLGLGLDEFSMPPPMVPKVKMIIRQISFELAQGIAQKAITYGTAKQVNKYLKGELKKIMNEEYYRLLGMS